MSDLEARLSGQLPIEPRRLTRTNFTNEVMERIEQATEASFRQQKLSAPFIGVINMYKSAKKISAAVVAGILALSIGTTFAAIQLTSNDSPTTPKTQVAGTQMAADGNTAVAITLTGCIHGNTSQVTNNEKVYYEIRKGSNLTPAQLKDYLQAICENDFPRLLFPYVSLTQTQYEAAWGPNGTHIQNYQKNVTLDSVSNGSIYVTIKSDFNAQTYQNVPIPLSPGAKIYQDMTPISEQNLRPGASLTIVMRTASLNVPITPGANNLSSAQQAALAPQGVPTGSSVVGIMQRVYSFDDEQAGWQTMGKDWTALTPDSSSPGGYRQITPLQ